MSERFDENCISLIEIVAALNDVATGRQTLHSVLTRWRDPREKIRRARICVEESRGEEEVKKEFEKLLRKLERVLEVFPYLN